MTITKQTRCPVCGSQPKRSLDQNKAYWALVHEIAQLRPGGQEFSAESWHEYLKQRFLGAEDIPLPNGKVVQRARSTASLDKDEMADYITQVEVWANEHGVYRHE